MYKIVESKKAKDELTELMLFYEKMQAKLGNRILEEYENILDTLESIPHHYFNISNSIRRILFKKFHCGVFYKINEQTVEILSVRDMRINPKKFPQ